MRHSSQQWLQADLGHDCATPLACHQHYSALQTSILGLWPNWMVAILYHYRHYILCRYNSHLPDVLVRTGQWRRNCWIEINSASLLKRLVLDRYYSYLTPWLHHDVSLRPGHNSSPLIKDWQVIQANSYDQTSQGSQIAKESNNCRGLIYTEDAN